MRSFKNVDFSILKTIIKDFKSFIFRKRNLWDKDNFYKKYSKKLYFVKNFNSDECESILKELQPDIIILGGARIIKNNIIDVPRIGIINAHPALLPDFRGVNVVEWSILNDSDLGVTVHFIDKGVDTGPIIIRKKYRLKKGDSLGIIRQKLEILAGILVTHTLLKLILKLEINFITQNSNEGKQYYRMSTKEKKETLEKLEVLKKLI